jgi:hypothetical protein
MWKDELLNQSPIPIHRHPHKFIPVTGDGTQCTPCSLSHPAEMRRSQLRTSLPYLDHRLKQALDKEAGLEGIASSRLQQAPQTSSPSSLSAHSSRSWKKHQCRLVPQRITSARSAHLRTFTDESSLALPTAHSRGRGRHEYPAYNRPMHKTNIAVKIVPSDDAAYTVVNAGDQIWRKRYSTMLAATSEAVELEIMTPSDKGLADMSQPAGRVAPLHNVSGYARRRVPGATWTHQR